MHMEVGGLGRARSFILWILGIFSFCNTWLLIPAIPSFLPFPLRFCQHSLQTEEPERGFESAVLAAQWCVPSLLPWPDRFLWHPMHVEGRLEKGWAGIGPSAVDFDLSRAGLLVCE